MLVFALARARGGLLAPGRALEAPARPRGEQGGREEGKTTAGGGYVCSGGGRGQCVFKKRDFSLPPSFPVSSGPLYASLSLRTDRLCPRAVRCPTARPPTGRAGNLSVLAKAAGGKSASSPPSLPPSLSPSAWAAPAMHCLLVRQFVRLRSPVVCALNARAQNCSSSVVPPSLNVLLTRASAVARRSVGAQGNR